MVERVSAAASPGAAHPAVLPYRIAFGTTVLERALHSNGHLDGIATYTAEMLRHLPAAGIVPRKVAFEGFRGTAIGADVRPLAGTFSRNLLKSALLGLPFSGNADMGRDFDLFHATDHHIPRYASLPVLANLMDPVPLMNPEWSDAHLRQVKNWFFRRSAGWADHYVTISHFVVDDLVRYFGVPREKISVVELGVDARYFERLPEATRERTMAELGIAGTFFLFVGTLQPRKNVLHLIEAFNRLPETIRRACPLIVAGRAGWSSEREREALSRLAANGTGRWLDYVTPLQKQALLQSARALVLPSLYEGFGLPVLEAFASGLPVIASNSSSIPEVAGEAACLIDPQDSTQLTEALARMHSDDAWHRRCAEAGSVRARAFTWSNTAQKTISLYRRILDR